MTLLQPDATCPMDPTQNLSAATPTQNRAKMRDKCMTRARKVHLVLVGPQVDEAVQDRRDERLVDEDMHAHVPVVGHLEVSVRHDAVHRLDQACRPEANAASLARLSHPVRRQALQPPERVDEDEQADSSLFGMLRPVWRGPQELGTRRGVNSTESPQEVDRGGVLGSGPKSGARFVLNLSPRCAVGTRVRAKLRCALQEWFRRSSVFRG